MLRAFVFTQKPKICGLKGARPIAKVTSVPGGEVQRPPVTPTLERIGELFGTLGTVVGVGGRVPA